MKNTKIYKSILIACTSSFILTGCQTKEQTHVSTSYENVQEETTTQKNIESSSEIFIEETKEIIETSKETKNTTETTSSEETNEEEIIFDNFQTEKEEIKEVIQSEDDTSIIQKGKDFFITAVDFIFYDAEYKGVTFDELTDEAKKQTYENLCTIDGWIMKITPTYKETISEKYTIVKDFLSDTGYKVLGKIKDYLGEENYAAIGDIKDQVMESIKNTGQKIKEKANDWYQGFKEH